jgi:hypothetical protein
MPPWLKLLTGIAATGLATDTWARFYQQRLLARLGAQAVPVLLAHNVKDASISWRSPTGWTFRTAHITGTARDPQAVAAAVAALPGIHAATFTQRAFGPPR